MENSDKDTQIYVDETNGIHGVTWNRLDCRGRRHEIAVVQVSDETHDYVAMTSNVTKDEEAGSNKSTRPLPADDKAFISKTFKSKSGQSGKTSSFKTKDSTNESGTLDDGTFYELRPVRNSGSATWHKTTTLQNQTSRGGDLPLNKNAAYSKTKLNSPSVYCQGKESPQVSVSSSNSSRRKCHDHGTHQDPSTPNCLKPTPATLLHSIKGSQTSSDDVGLVWWERRIPVPDKPVTPKTSSQVGVGCCNQSETCPRSCQTQKAATIEIEIPLKRNTSLGHQSTRGRVSNETPIRRPPGPYVSWWEKSDSDSQKPWDNSVSKTTTAPNKSENKRNLTSAEDRTRLNEPMISLADDPSRKNRDSDEQRVEKASNTNEPQSICCPNCSEPIIFSKAR